MFEHPLNRESKYSVCSQVFLEIPVGERGVSAGQ